MTYLPFSYIIRGMESAETIIIGGGAAGLTAALALNKKTIVLERGARVGRKLSATGNGQGNVGNLDINESRYFTFGERRLISSCMQKFPQTEILAFFEKLGFMFCSDDRGRIYPASRQASSITDLIRYRLETDQNKKVITGAFVTDITKKGEYFTVTALADGEKRLFSAKNVILCAGGKAAKNFGSDGNGYSLAEKFGHTATGLFPSLVQLKTETKDIKTLKGQRVGAVVAAYCDNKQIAREKGDVIFTDYGVSGDAVFRISAFVCDKIDRKVTLSLDLMPDCEIEKLVSALRERAANKAIPAGEMLCGILSNTLGRAVIKRAGTQNPVAVAQTIKNFTLEVTGTAGFDYAQVTKGGIRLSEVGADMQSKKCPGLYFAGEILDVDGQCGGYNLQWAFSSALTAAESINND